MTKKRPSFVEPTVLETDPPARFASILALKEGNSKKPIYCIHKWWARRLGSVFRTILLAANRSNRQSSAREVVRQFYGKNDLAGLTVLDPFVGGGTTVLEAAKCGANVIGVDIDPVACFVTSAELQHVDEDRLRRAFADVERRCKDDILKWYRTKTPDGKPATIVYAFWVDQITCPKCDRTADAHPHFQLSRDPRTKKQTVFCSGCGELARLPLSRKNLLCARCNASTRIDQGPMNNGIFTCQLCGHHTRAVSESKEEPFRRRLFGQLLT